MNTPDVLISGLGAFLPDWVPIGWAVERGLIDQTAAEEDGITSVTIAGELPAPEMAVRACQQALGRAGQEYPPGATVPGKLDFGNTKRRWLDGPDRDPVGPLKLVAAQDELISRTLDESAITLADITRVAYANGSRERVEDRAMGGLNIACAVIEIIIEGSCWSAASPVGVPGVG